MTDNVILIWSQRQNNLTQILYYEISNSLSELLEHQPIYPTMK